MPWVGPFRKADIQREMAASDLHTRRIGGNQRKCDAAVGFAAQQVFRVVQFERQAEQRGRRSERDVALLPCQAYAQHMLLPAEFAVAHDAVIGDRTGIRSGERSGQREAGHFQALRQPMQILILLFFRSIVQQQFRRPEGIRHHHRHGCGTAARTHFAHYRRMSLCGKLQSAITLRDDHPEETPVLDELPGFGRQVGALVRDVPIVQHRAQLLNFVVEKRLLALVQSALREGQQLVPVGIAAEQLAIPPHRAGIDRFLLGGGNLRQNLAEDFEHRSADHIAAHVRDAEEHDKQQQRGTDHDQHIIRETRHDRDHRHHHHDRQYPAGDRSAEKSQQNENGQRGQDGQCHDICISRIIILYCCTLTRYRKQHNDEHSIRTANVSRLRFHLSATGDFTRPGYVRCAGRAPAR